jgi:uncharacterized lipoprotein YbaY
MSRKGENPRLGLSQERSRQGRPCREINLTSRPAGAPREIVGTVELPRPLDLEGSLVMVALLNVSLADAPALPLAETRFPAPSGEVLSIPFRLAIGTLPPHGRLALSAEVHRDMEPELRSGDLRNVRSVPWDASDPGKSWKIPVVEI